MRVLAVRTILHWEMQSKKMAVKTKKGKWRWGRESVAAQQMGHGIWGTRKESDGGCRMKKIRWE